MGLRLWKDPDDDAAIIEDAAAKLDRAAATRRSTIRREPSVRPGRDHLPPQSISGFLRNRHQNMLRTRDRLRQEERETDSQIALLSAELNRLRRLRHRNMQRLGDDLTASYAGRDLSDSSSLADQISPNENTESTTDSSLESSRQPLPRPPRESNLRFEFLPSSISRSTSPWRYQVLSGTTMPSPPRSTGSGRRDMSIPDGPIPDETWSIDNPRMPALTEGFAPARIGSRDRHRRTDTNLSSEDYQGLETPPPESWEGSLPPLHRVGHVASPRPLPRIGVDGLGDRRRSVSPFSDQNEEDTWMSHLLTTMDTTRSSSATSFTSSHADNTRRSNHSSQTTSTSFGEIGSLDDTCELDLPEGITEADVRAIRERHGNSREPLGDRHIILALASLRDHMDRVGNTEYGMFQAILERMQRREPIPQDWWVTVGLPPDFGRSY